jgi:hypothetical protein
MDLRREHSGEREVGGRQVLQTLLIETEGKSWEQEICLNDKREIIGNKVLKTEEWACADWKVPKVVWTLRGRQMLVVRKQNATDTGACLLPLQLVERPADRDLMGGGKGHGRECRQMPACANL